MEESTERKDGLSIYKSIQYEEGSIEREMGFERIIVLTDAQKESNNTFAWEDGQRFAIKAVMFDGEIDMMPLQFFQFASFEMASFIKSEEEEFCVIVNIATGAKYEIRKYNFDQDQKNFIEEIIYDATNINYVRQSK